MFPFFRKQPPPLGSEQIIECSRKDILVKIELKLQRTQTALGRWGLPSGTVDNLAKYSRMEFSFKNHNEDQNGCLQLTVLARDTTGGTGISWSYSSSDQVFERTIDFTDEQINTAIRE